ncbi:hypothetical protein ACHAQA_009852 [Verticillium albo-atrum]
MSEISDYTQTLDLFEKLCRSRGYGSLRLNSTVNVNERQSPSTSSTDPEGQEFVFILSSKAGGSGINLIIASRVVVLFDPTGTRPPTSRPSTRVWQSLLSGVLPDAAWLTSRPGSLSH